jgi:hypothetical protein
MNDKRLFRPARMTVTLVLLVAIVLVFGVQHPGFARGAPPTPVTVAAGPPFPPESQFVHWADSGNTTGSTTTIDHSLTNNRPNALLFVTTNVNPPGLAAAPNPHSVGVYYLGSRWAIFNQDLADMPVSAASAPAFNVLVLTPGSNAFVHTTTSTNTQYNYTYLDHPLTNNRPNTLVFVTPNANPGGGGGTWDDHNIGVWYASGVNKWSIFNQEQATMTLNLSFNVLVVSSPSAAAFVHTATAEDSAEHNYTILGSPCTNDRRAALLFVTPNWNPGGIGGTYNDHTIGVYYYGWVSWAIFNQDSAQMTPGSAFTVLTACSAYLPQVKK